MVKLNKVKNAKLNCLEVNGEEVLPEYSYLSNIGKSSVILSSYIKLVSLLFICICLQNAGLLLFNSAARNSARF